MIKKFDDFIDLWFFAWQFWSFFSLFRGTWKKTKFWKVSCLLSDFIDGITTKFMGFTRNIYSYFRSQQSLIVSLEKSRLISKFSWPFGLFLFAYNNQQCVFIIVQLDYFGYLMSCFKPTVFYTVLPSSIDRREKKKIYNNDNNNN